jgi:hypothetical protein
MTCLSPRKSCQTCRPAQAENDERDSHHTRFPDDGFSRPVPQEILIAGSKAGKTLAGGSGLHRKRNARLPGSLGFTSQTQGRTAAPQRSPKCSPQATQPALRAHRPAQRGDRSQIANAYRAATQHACASTFWRYAKMTVREGVSEFAHPDAELPTAPSCHSHCTPRHLTRNFHECFPARNARASRHSAAQILE